MLVDIALILIGIAAIFYGIGLIERMGKTK